MDLYQYLLHLGDNALVLGHRNSEWCGHGPVLEQDIALTNIALDLIGQARLFYQYAATLSDAASMPWGATEDAIAYGRDAFDYRNCLLVEQPNGDWACTILRQFLFSAYQYELYERLVSYGDSTIAAIAAKALKEVAYHLRWSGEWVVRLGDGTDESRTRLLNALSDLWMFTGELFKTAPYEKHIGVDLQAFYGPWTRRLESVFAQAGLEMPVAPGFQTGGKTGVHTEHLGYLLAEMQFLQRAYPGSTW